MQFIFVVYILCKNEKTLLLLSVQLFKGTAGAVVLLVSVQLSSCSPAANRVMITLNLMISNYKYGIAMA